VAGASMGGAATRRALVVNAGELLQRIAHTLRHDIGPAVDAEYPKTQAFMAAVVLQKLGRELALADAHRTADATELRALAADLVAVCTTSAPAGATTQRDAAATSTVPANAAAAVDRFAATLDQKSLCDVIESLYAARAELDAAHVDALLGRIRRTLRAQIDRRLEFAK